MADLFTPEDVPELDCPACGKVFRLVEGEAECPACGWTPKDGDAPRPRTGPARPTSTTGGEPSTSPGKPRSILACLLLGVVTLGLYFLFWHYAAFEEMRLHTRTRQRVELFFAALVLNLVAFVWMFIEPSLAALALQGVSAGVMATYLFLETRHVRATARAAGVPSMAWPAGFFLVAAFEVASLATTGRTADLFSVLTVIAALLAYPFVQMTLNDYWRRAKQSHGAPAPTAAPA